MSQTTNAQEKQALRSEIRRLKRLQRSEDLRVWSEKICGRVLELNEWRQASTVLLYAALPDEVNTEGLQEAALAAGKRCLLPVVQGDILKLRPYTRATVMQSGPFHIAEPFGEDFVDYAAIDLAIIPAMAYDLEGHRLGRGKGYYDRLLPLLNCPLIGIAYPFQILEKIPVEPWDIPVRRVVSVE